MKRQKVGPISPDNSKILVIVDMQPDAFPAACCKSTQRNVARLTAHAVKRGWPVAVVEYRSTRIRRETTARSIREVLFGYKHKFKVIKNKDNGGPDVFQALWERSIKPDHFIVCGVNLDCCVDETAEWIASQDKRVDVIVDACNSNSGMDWAVRCLERAKFTHCNTTELIEQL